jgi:3-oxoisoapionate decarboxylase
MRLGLSSYACAWAIGVPGHEAPSPMDAKGFVRHAAKLGVRLVQIADNLPLERASDPELGAVRDAAVSAGVAIELGARGISPPHIQRMIDLCEFFGSALLRIVVDTAFSHPTPDEVVATVSGMLPSLQQRAVKLAIENHDRFPARTLVRILERIGSPDVGICLDTVNSLGCGEGPQYVVEQLAPFTISLHVKDFSIRRASHMMGFTVTGTPAGEGALDIPWLLGKLRAADRDPNVLLELWPAPEHRVEDTIRKEEQWRRDSIRYLRTVIPEEE